MTVSRKELADLVVERAYEIQQQMFPGTMLLRIHWDDCDMDERRFWFHFRRPGLTNVRETKAPVIRDCKALIRRIKAQTLKMLEPSIYECYWHLHSRPEMRYKQFDYKRYPEGYDDDTWQYVLSFYG